MPPPTPHACLPVLVPHQAPFRLLDRVVAVDLDDRSLRAERRLTLNDALWPAESQPPAHFFSDPAAPAGLVFPATLLIEALCQAAACFNSLAFAARPEAGGPHPPQHHGYLVAIRDFKFPAFVYVGETLVLEVAQKEKLGQVIAFAVRATVKTGPNPIGPIDRLDPIDPIDPIHVQPREVASGRLLFAVTGA